MGKFIIGYAHILGYSNAAMYKTVDGGNTWNLNFETDTRINAFDFVDKDNGYFVGDHGLIYKTNDGGLNWQQLEIPYEWYNEVNFQTKNIGFIATPSYVYGYNTNLVTGYIYNALPNQTYYYKLVANNNGSPISSNTYQYTTGTLGQNDFDLNKEISIYPNPATDFLTLKSNTTEKFKSIEFYNAVGQRIKLENYYNDSDVIKVDVSNLRR